MRPIVTARSLGLVLTLSAGVVAWASCSATGDVTSNPTATGGFGGNGSSDSSNPTNSMHASTGALNIDGSNGCSTCESLDANCGVVTDPKCGGTIKCGDCPSGKTCGGAGEHNKCGVGDGDGCAPSTCADQHVTCGMAGDGCGNAIDCGGCSAPQTCGGDPTKPSACGCTGLCAQVPTCTGGATTTLTGKVYDPAHKHPLYNALVYVPNDPTDPGLQPFPEGVTCDVCGATAAGNPLVTAQTAVDGTFTLSGVPVGGSVPLVIQLGKWRRQFTVSIQSSCGANSVDDATLTMPKDHGEGDIPRIGILSGGLDPVECVLRKMGIHDSEFSNPNGAGHIQFYMAKANSPHSGKQGGGVRIDDAMGTTPAQDQLFAPYGAATAIDRYDLVILECEGYAESQSAAQKAALGAYANSGGRVFSSDFAYTWYEEAPAPFQSVANWHVNQLGGGTSTTATIDKVSNPKGAVFQQWLELVGVSSPGSGTVSIYPVFHNSDAVIPPTQQWLYWAGGTPIHFTWNTPVDQPASQCGRAVYSDWHAQVSKFSNGTVFPGVCDDGAMTPQEAILEFMLFDLSSCVQPYMPACTPKTCADQGVECGAAGDGCGAGIDCGDCPAGETCGGGGPGKCGHGTSCDPLSCHDQGIECGKAGDGCGHAINCGNCPTGEICGANGPGKCGGPH